MTHNATNADILDRLRTILRRDLKLSQAGEIPDDFPLIGGEMDLDSLDVLLLVSSVEKQFGLKFPTQSMGESAFRNLTTLAAYIREHLNNATQPPVDYLAMLPHRSPFLFVSRVTSVQPGATAEGVWAVTGEEAFLQGHFPGQPIVPGVLLAEALAQISGLAGPRVNGNPPATGRLAHVEVRLNQAVIPPAEIVLKSRLTRVMGSLRQFEVTATLGTAIVAEGSVTLHQPDGETPAEVRKA